MRKFFKKPWVWMILAVCLIGPVVVFWPLLVLALFPFKQEIKAPQAGVPARNKLVDLIKAQDSDGAQLSQIRLLPDEPEALYKPHSQMPQVQGSAVPLDVWQIYLLSLQQADGIPDRELKILRRDIHLLGLPDPARIPYEPGP